MVESEIEAATGYHPSMSCCQSAKDHVEHRIRQAVEDERRACALVAEQCWHGPGDYGCPHGTEISTAIRSRGEEK